MAYPRGSLTGYPWWLIVHCHIELFKLLVTFQPTALGGDLGKEPMGSRWWRPLVWWRPLSKCFLYHSVPPSVCLDQDACLRSRSAHLPLAGRLPAGPRPTRYVTDWFGRIAAYRNGPTLSIGHVLSQLLPRQTDETFTHCQSSLPRYASTLSTLCSLNTATKW